MSAQLKSTMSKKLTVITKLLEQRYEDEIYITCISDILHCDFKNKPDQILQLQFAAFDTWDQIKRKMDKLKESDGICVVCCEMEKPKKKIVKVPCPHGCKCGKTILVPEYPAGICNSCSEFICRSCWNKMGSNKCPVCRVCLGTYKHKLDTIHRGELVECHCNDE